MLKLRLDGLTYRDIANRAGISRQRVQQLLSPPPKIRQFVLDKYDDRCNRCGVYVGYSGHVHHNGDNPETYNDINNLELLCLSCHRKAHFYDTFDEIDKDTAEGAMRKLTPREQKVMELVKQGLTNRQIATQLGLSEQTVKNHLMSAYIKLNAHNRITALIALADEEGSVK